MDLVGWYTLVPKTGPTADVLPIHAEILERYNESAILLGFHIEDVLQPVTGNPLPITIYESNYEAEDTAKDSAAQGEDEQMKDSEAPSKMVLRFRELPYGTETGEAEMIAMQFIREGAAHATRQADSKKTTTDKKGKGKQLATSSQQAEPAAPVDKDANLTKDELEQISALQTKANAIKMMHQRISLLIAYLENLHPDFLNGTSDGTAPTGNHLPASQNILRQIQALVTNIELATPTQEDELEKEMLQETNDVKLIGMIKDMFTTVSELRDVGKRFGVVESNKGQKTRSGNRDFPEYGGGGGGAGGGASQQASLGGVGDLHML